MSKLPVNSNTRRLFYVALGMMLMSIPLLSISIAGIFSDTVINMDEGFFRFWNISTSLLMGIISLAMGFMILKVWQRESEAITLIEWLRGMDDITSAMRYPINSDVLRPVGDWVSQLFRKNRGWIMLVQVPGLLISGEVLRRKYLPVISSEIQTGWDVIWAENYLKDRLDNSKGDHFGDLAPFLENGIGSFETWGVHSKDGDFSIAILVALDTKRSYSNYPLFDDIIEAALSLVVKRLSVLLIDVVDRREKLGSEGLGLLYRMLIHEVSGELQGSENYLFNLSQREVFANNFGLQTDSQMTLATIARARHWLDVMKDAPLLQDKWVPIEPQPVMLDDKINKTIGSVQGSWPSVTFVVKGQKNLTVLADGHLDSVLRNVFFNAGSFSPEDGIVKILVTADTDFANIRVIDQGPGLSEELAKILFDISVPSEKRPNGYKGAGVGLAAAYQIARAYGGNLTCFPRSSSETGGGEFLITLPLAK